MYIRLLDACMYFIAKAQTIAYIANAYRLTIFRGDESNGGGSGDGNHTLAISKAFDYYINKPLVLVGRLTEECNASEQPRAAFSRSFMG